MHKIYVLIIILFGVISVFAQENAVNQSENEQIVQLVSEKQYDKALEIINKNIGNYYSENVDNKRLPTDFITVESAEEAVDLNKVYRERKNKIYIIEINDDMYLLHFNAAKCYAGMGEYDRAISHYYQALRFSEIQLNKTDEIFYNLALTFKAIGAVKAYNDSLETAIEINPSNPLYSLELGNSLYRSGDNKRSIYHLEKYLASEQTEVNPDIYLKLAALHEQGGKYLNTVKYYQKYLEVKPEDADVRFALGYAAYYHTGNYEVAFENFNYALKILPEDQVYKRSKSYEYIADMYRKNLKFEKAIEAYKQTAQFELTIKKQIDSLRKELDYIDSEIVKLKAGLLKEKNFVNYTQYQFQLSEKDRVKRELDQKMYEYRKLNSGKIRWYTAECYEKLEDYENAIVYYRQSITYNYNANKSREKIIKLQLKIKHGY